MEDRKKDGPADQGSEERGLGKENLSSFIRPASARRLGSPAPAPRRGAASAPLEIRGAKPAEASPRRQGATPASLQRGRRPEPPRMGGIALKNGLVLLSEHNWAAAIRDATGGISVASGRKPRLVSEGGGVIPLLRGLGRFGESLIVLGQVKARLPRAELPLEGGRVAAALGASLLATSAVKSLAPKSAVIQEAGGALAAFVPAILALKGSAITGYHGAEHKLIGGRELEQQGATGVAPAGAPRAATAGRVAPLAGSAATPGAAAPRSSVPAPGSAASRGSAAAAKEHDRCGSNLVGPYLLATVATNLVARGRSGRKSPAASAIAGAVSLGVALEALRWATKHGDTLAARLMLLPGRTVQKHLTTAEPTAEQLEVGERALAELLRLEAASV